MELAPIPQVGTANPHSDERAMARSKKVQKAIDEGKLVETINSLDYDHFAKRYCSAEDIGRATSEIFDATGRYLAIDLMFSKPMYEERKDIFRACFSLIEGSSADDYRKSSRWSPTSKRNEMTLPDLRYLVVSDAEVDREGRLNEIRLMGGTSTSVCGFVSFMITYEDGQEVIYVYEIHLAPQLRGLGVGKTLMALVEDTGRKTGVDKCMLTVFKCNERAVRWYKLNDFVVDDSSPGPRVLRNGTVKEPTYIIMSKVLRSRPQDS